MPIPIAEAVAEQADLARTKAVAAKNVPKFLFSSALAGAFVGVGIVLLAATTGPLAAANSPAVKLVAGAVFGVALTLVVMAGSELFTGLNMVMLQGLAAGTVNALEVLFVWISSLVGNLIGALAFSWLINAGGTLSAKTPAGKLGPGEAFIESLVKAKNAAPGAQLFWRALACNMLVCLAVWMAARTRNDAAKVMLIWWCLMAFIAVGLEHSIANMTIFGVAIYHHAAGYGDLFRNLAWTVPGNIVGGGLVIGLGYAWIAGKGPALVAEAVEPTPVAPNGMAAEPAVAR
ncbi:MAG TPA: formate/nitrite transporter family protein [Acidimicrobiia bacterium]|nr:formate/nitrite transporter family protein [Acidimicrobiia bacterium]